MKCTHLVKDGTMDVVNFENHLKERVAADGETHNFGNKASLELKNNKISLTSGVRFYFVDY